MRRPLLFALVLALFIGFGIVQLVAHSGQTQTSVMKSPSPKWVQVAKQPVMIQLSGATPISAIHENYNQPSSLWVLVSKSHPLETQSYVPTPLKIPAVRTRTDKSVEERSLRTDVEPAIKNLFEAANAAGHDVMLASGYRSYEQQQIYFSNYSRAYGEEAANKFSARPGQSEHQTGLAFDVSLSSRQCYLEVCFGDTEAGKWFASHSYEYGFILRYPSDKTAITEYQYEPWHFRYVGKDLAKALFESNLTLDEAYSYLQTALSELKSRGEVK